MSKRMCHQVLNQMDEYLSKKPFVRPHWWSRRWIVYITIQPPITESHPLWNRSKDELQLLRLFNLSPEELGRKIEHYWKKPRWRRWFASFGMNKKIDVWNYYQRCLAYKAIARNQSETELKLVIASEKKSILEKLGLALHQSNVKFEMYLEKHCRHPKWVEKSFLEETKRYQQQQKKKFSIKLDKYLKQLESNGERTTLKQQAEQEYQQVEALMFNYYQLHFNALRRLQHSENKKSQKKEKNTDRRIEIYQGSLSIPSSSRASFSRAILQNEIGSLDKSKEWIQAQRQRLKAALIQKDSPEAIEKLLQNSLTAIKNIIEPQLNHCELIISSIEGDHNAYDSFLADLGSLQNQLKPLLQEGLRLFHPDHMMSLSHSEKVWTLITHYSQIYIEQSRFYLECLKNYYQHIGDLYKKHLQMQQALQERAEIKIEILKLKQTLIDLSKEWEKDRKIFLEEVRAEFKQYMAEMRAEERAQDRAEFESIRAQDRAEFESIRAQDRAEFEQKNVAMEAKLERIMALLQLQQQSTSLDTAMSSNKSRFFNPR